MLGQSLKRAMPDISFKHGKDFTDSQNKLVCPSTESEFFKCPLAGDVGTLDNEVFNKPIAKEDSNLVGGLNLTVLYCGSSSSSQEFIRKTPNTCCAAISTFQAFIAGGL
ncbi:hypothetical protein E4U14_008022 [Claviceps sp. LM454 group G7]|nr:hypothetical protein E4U14_008022 [Claviceps sp. LM454 group G7]